MPPPPSILPRAAAGMLETALRAMRVVVVTGPRQAGKSTLVRTDPLLRARPYFTLDDPLTLQRIRDNRRAFLASEPEMTIDEVQRDPPLLVAIKQAVDEARPQRRGQFVLTGSANLLMMKQVGDSLSGRAYYLRLLPLTRREQLGLGSTGLWTRFFDVRASEWLDLVRAQDVAAQDWRQAASRGGFPAAAIDVRDERERSIWFDGYIATYLERDLRDLQAVTNLRDFQALMKASALRIGGLLNHAELGRDVGMPATTVHQYLNLLETSFQALRLAPYARNLSKRLIKTPKLYWNDVGLALHLGAEEPRGAHLENLVLTDLLAWAHTQTPRPEVTYWRTAGGAEVDFIVERKRALLAVEVKAGSAPTAHDARHLKSFLEEYGRDVRGGLVLHGGERSYWIDERILAAPWWAVV